MKLLLHIGYPKTATTTLQEEVFLGLHKQGLINYLGRTITSTHTRTGRSNFKGEDWVVKLRKHLMLNKAFDVDRANMVSDKLNVLSDEDLTFHPFFAHKRFDVFKDPFEFPARLKNLLGEDVEVSLLVTIRNQAELIYSSFVQKYRFINSDRSKVTFADFLYQGKHTLDENHLALYDFGRMINAYTSVFKAPVTILLFEDFLNDKMTFSKRLANVLSVSESVVQALVSEKHYRKRKKSEEGVEVSTLHHTALGKLLAMMLGEKRYEQWREERYLMRNSRLLQKEKNLLIRSQKLFIPALQEKERNEIRTFFSRANAMLANQHQLDQGKMKKYGYVQE